MPTSVINRIRNAPQINWKKIKDLVLGKKYDLTAVLVADSEMRRAEKLSRHKKRANVLSFAYSKSSGEILLNIPRIRHEAKKYGEPTKQYLLYLYIHSLLHLKGYDHKKTKDAKMMASQETRYLAQFGF